MGALTRTDFRLELKSRGFSGFTDDALNRYINWGLFEIARKAPWTWEKAEVTIAIDPGEHINILGHESVVTELKLIRSINQLYLVTPGFESKMKILDDREFFEHWLRLPLATDAGLRATPHFYRLWARKLYTLPPADTAHTIRAHVTNRFPVMDDETDKTPMPEDYDEAVLLAAEVRCHRRANQYQHAQNARFELTMLFGELLTEQHRENEEEIDRAIPWLGTIGGRFSDSN